MSVAISYDSKFIVSASESENSYNENQDNTIIVWDRESGI